MGSVPMLKWLQAEAGCPHGRARVPHSHLQMISRGALQRPSLWDAVRHQEGEAGLGWARDFLD